MWTYIFILLITTLSLVNRPYSDHLFCFLQNSQLLSRVTVLFYILMIWLWLVSVLSSSESEFSIFTIFGSIYSGRSEEIVPYFILHSSGDSDELFHSQLISYLLVRCLLMFLSCFQNTFVWFCFIRWVLGFLLVFQITWRVFWLFLV